MNSFRDWLRQQICASEERWLPFSEWMEASLYHPQWGYYMRPKKKIGKCGDYYTSSSVGTVFGAVLAEGLFGLLESLSAEEWVILELGGGDGRLACQILNAFQRHPSIYRKLTYFMLEKSPFHRQLQFKHLISHKERIVYLDSLEQLQGVTGVIISNEFFDALPVHILERHDGKWEEVGVTWNEHTLCFEEERRPCRNQRLLELLEELAIAAEEGGRVELSLAAVEWINQLASVLEKGYLLTVDYGYLADGAASAAMPKGTLRGYRMHQIMTNPYLYPGEQDLTADVNFSLLIEMGKKACLEPLLFESQRKFLLRLGILEELAEGADDPFSAEARKNRAIRQLLLDETGMGERFCVLLQGKNVFVPRVFRGLSRQVSFNI
jgi:SAM-dependent MidA family methyltransferase